MRAVAIFLIRVYQRTLSPLTRGACRHVPSCSAYAAEAIERHGVLRGASLAARRVLRCHPFGTSGYDPVPSPERKGRDDSKRGRDLDAIAGTGR